MLAASSPGALVVWRAVVSSSSPMRIDVNLSAERRDGAAVSKNASSSPAPDQPSRVRRLHWAYRSISVLLAHRRLEPPVGSTEMLPASCCSICAKSVLDMTRAPASTAPEIISEFFECPKARRPTLWLFGNQLRQLHDVAELRRFDERDEGAEERFHLTT